MSLTSMSSLQDPRRQCLKAKAFDKVVHQRGDKELGILDKIESHDYYDKDKMNKNIVVCVGHTADSLANAEGQPESMA